MTPAPRPRIRLLLLVVLAAQAVIGVLGVWLLAGLGPAHGEAVRDHSARLAAMANLHASLTDAERMTLFAVIQGDRLHPDVPAGFRACIDRARAECRAARENSPRPGDGPAVDRLTASVEEVARRGDALLTAPAGERDARYTDPDTGFQAAVTAAWWDLSAIRAADEVALQDADRAAREAAGQAAWTLGIVAGLSLLATALAGCRLGRAAPC